MKVIILAGGFGTRLSEETDFRPKPMVEVGGKPIIWHIMKIYSHYGFNDFILLLGYKGNIIRNFFLNYHNNTNDLTINLKDNTTQLHSNSVEPWKVTLVDTGEATMTGGRLKRVRDYVSDETFCFTYGDGVSNVNITETINFHHKHGKLTTITSVQPPGRYGSIECDHNNEVTGFVEKPRGDGGSINGGFFVLSPAVLEQIENDETSWESEPLSNLASMGEVMAFKHAGFWQPMDTMRDKNQLENLWNSDNAPWKIWK